MKYRFDQRSTGLWWCLIQPLTPSQLSHPHSHSLSHTLSTFTNILPTLSPSPLSLFLSLFLTHTNSHTLLTFTQSLSHLLQSIFFKPSPLSLSLTSYPLTPSPLSLSPSLPHSPLTLTSKSKYLDNLKILPLWSHFSLGNHALIKPVITTVSTTCAFT